MKIKAVYVGRYNEQTQAYSLCKENNKTMKDDMQKVYHGLMYRLELK